MSKNTISKHQLQRRELWLAIAKIHEPGSIKAASDALAAFDAAFSEPGSQKLEAEVGIIIHGDVQVTPHAEPVARPPLNVIELVLRGDPGSGKTELLNYIADGLGSVIDQSHRETVKVVRVFNGSGRLSDDQIRRMAGGCSRVLLITDEA